ncbi:hypothetical protein WICPIJ_003987 [Wickerhamomyces pijperi]|uniref:Uncharacterized protein n=1 Tax=Wickerhamomyces pijperi TaxID=599730 RepID=A0A9P8Q8L0_WICPI|nr:hypothetical protein WICPIJ_003987 [Wickerhamomyces pijperi]
MKSKKLVPIKAKQKITTLQDSSSIGTFLISATVILSFPFFKSNDLTVKSTLFLPLRVFTYFPTFNENIASPQPISAMTTLRSLWPGNPPGALMFLFNLSLTWLTNTSTGFSGQDKT